MKLSVLMFMFVAAVSCLANEPGWTSEERAEQRQVVLDATVTKIEKIRDQPIQEVELMKAVLKISDLWKGKEILNGADTIEVLYESSPLGENYRCPSFPLLRLNQHSRFYLCYDESLSKEKSLVLGMGRDVERLPLNTLTTMPKLLKALSKNPSFDELAQIFGKPYAAHADDKRGGYVFVYFLDQGSPITVGTPDKKKVLYVDQGKIRLYPMD